MLNPLKYACRQLARTPGFTVVAVLILATGIGATAAIFTLMNGLLFRALPARDPDSLVLFTNVRTTTAGATVTEQFAHPLFEHLHDHAQSLAGIAAVKNSQRKLAPNPADPGSAVPVRSSEVSGDFFPLLGVTAALGRTLSPDDDRKNHGRPVAVLSDSLWRRQFGAAKDVLGRTVILDNVAFTVVGVMPASFFGIEPASPVELWIPAQTLPLLEPGSRDQLNGSRVFMLIGRLRAGMTRAAANAELDALYQAGGTDFGAGAATRDRASTWGKLALEPGGSGRVERRQDLGQLFVAVFVVVGFVLVIVCANIASLLLARTAARQHELAVRAALGAGRGRLVGQLLTEGLVLSGAGGLLGLLMVRWILDAIASRPGAPAAALPADARVLVFVFLVSALTGVLVGLLPALKFSRVDVNATLQDRSGTSAGGRRSRTVQVLVVAQIAISVCLLAGAGVFVRTLQALKNVEVGFRRENLLLVNVSVPKGYAESRRANLLKELLGSFAALPGVKSATVSAGGLWDGSQLSSGVRVEGYVAQANEDMRTYFTLAGPDFFAHMGVPLRRGRGFAPEEIFATDFSHPRFVVINESFAKRFFGDADPLGRTITLLSGKAEIVGVAANVKYLNLRDENSLQIYLPFAPMPGGTQFTVSLRTGGDQAAGLAPNAAAVVQRLDPNARLGSLEPMEKRVTRFVQREQLIAQIAGGFGAFGLLLACLGLYGLLAYDVAQRTREFGVRLALGAAASDLISLVVKQGMKLAALGCVIGSLAAFGLVHFIASRLFGVSAADPLTFAGTSVLLLAVSLLACWLPCYRATQADPMTALRAS